MDSFLKKRYILDYRLAWLLACMHAEWIDNKIVFDIYRVCVCIWKFSICRLFNWFISTENVINLCLILCMYVYIYLQMVYLPTRFLLCFLYKLISIHINFNFITCWSFQLNNAKFISVIKLYISKYLCILQVTHLKS